MNIHLIVQGVDKAKTPVSNLNKYLRGRMSQVTREAYFGEKPKQATVQALKGSDGNLYARDSGDQFLQVTSKRFSCPRAKWRVDAVDEAIEDLAKKLPAGKKITILQSMEFFLGEAEKNIVFYVSGKFSWAGSYYNAGKIGGKHLVLPGDARQLIQTTTSEETSQERPVLQNQTKSGLILPW